MKMFVLAFLVVVSPCFAETFTVDDDGDSADFSTIQEAIDWAWDGDMVVVHPDSYQVDSLRPYGKAITITSKNYIDTEVTSATILYSDLEYA